PGTGAGAAAPPGAGTAHRGAGRPGLVQQPRAAGQPAAHPALESPGHGLPGDEGEPGRPAPDPAAGHHPPPALPRADAAADLAVRRPLGPGHRLARRLGGAPWPASAAPDDPG